MYRSNMGEVETTQTGWSRAKKGWVGLVAFCLVVVAIGIYLFATPPKASNNTPPPDQSKTTGVITVPGTPAEGQASTATPTITLGGNWTGRDPSTIGFSGDAGNVVSDLSWPTWTASGAVGHGTWESETCVPDCATGSTVPYPATITLSAPVNGQFTALVEQTHGMTQHYTLPGTNVGPWGS